MDKSSNPKFNSKLCLITDFRFIPEDQLERIISEAISGGVDSIHYRDKNSELKKQINRATRIKRITEQTNTPLIINSLPYLVKEIDAQGLHISSHMIPSLKKIREEIGYKKILGVSTHGEKEIIAASAEQTDYLIISPLFSPGSKVHNSPLGKKEFSRLCSLTSLPVIALGGINKQNAHTPFHLGANGVACITGLLQSQDIKETARAMREKM